MDPIDIFINLTLLVLFNVAIRPDITAHLVGTNMHNTALQAFLQAVATKLFGLYCVCSFFVVPFYLRTRTIHPTARCFPRIIEIYAVLKCRIAVCHKTQVMLQEYIA
jgi:hypothetical protein